jgi:hypothetical protein
MQRFCFPGERTRARKIGRKRIHQPKLDMRDRRQRAQAELSMTRQKLMG